MGNPPLHSTQNRSSRRRFPEPISWLGMEKTKPNTTEITQSLIKINVLWHKINAKKLKPGLVAFYDTRPRNGADLFSMEKISKGEDKYAKSKEKRISWEAYNINRQTIYIAQTHTHTHSFNGHFSGTTQVSRYQKGKTNLDFTGARDSEWQWHQLGHASLHLAPDR